MKIYTTYGTYDYLNQIRLNHPENHLFIYSTNDSSVIIDEINELNHQHFYSAIFIPSSEDHVNQLEKRLSNLNLDFSQFAGFKSYRFLRPEEGTTYKIYFGFANRQTYEDFKSSDMFNDYFSKEALRHYFGSSSQHSSYFERYLYPIND